VEELSMEYDHLTGKVIGCAYDVYNKLGNGFLESVYENCMMIELRKAGLLAENQKELSVSYDGERVGTFQADIIVEGELIVELKAVSQLVTKHEVQLVNYLSATNKQTGLLLNFGEHGVEVKRKFRSRRRTGTPHS
jgi:GxxExxY protein